jgi:hypothetical protein
MDERASMEKPVANRPSRISARATPIRDARRFSVSRGSADALLFLPLAPPTVCYLVLRRLCYCAQPARFERAKVSSNELASNLALAFVFVDDSAICSAPPDQNSSPTKRPSGISTWKPALVYRSGARSYDTRTDRLTKRDARPRTNIRDAED